MYLATTVATSRSLIGEIVDQSRALPDEITLACAHQSGIHCECLRHDADYHGSYMGRFGEILPVTSSVVAFEAGADAYEPRRPT